jgi:tRNA-dihydrouridine synthase
MLGRGAIARPELFRVLRGIDPEFWPASRRVRFLERFVEASILARPGEASQRGILQHLKQWCRAMAAGDPAIEVLFEVLKRSETLDAARDLLARA